MIVLTAVEILAVVLTITGQQTSVKYLDLFVLVYNFFLEEKYDYVRRLFAQQALGVL